jgi:hypothetical protein
MGRSAKRPPQPHTTITQRAVLRELTRAKFTGEVEAFGRRIGSTSRNTWFAVADLANHGLIVANRFPAGAGLHLAITPTGRSALTRANVGHNRARFGVNSA